MNQQRFELLEQLEEAVRTGVNCVFQLNGAEQYGSFVERLETKQRMDSAWVEILRLLRELDAQLEAGGRDDEDG